MRITTINEETSAVDHSVRDKRYRNNTTNQQKEIKRKIKDKTCTDQNVEELALASGRESDM
jgi:hypothetical protein